MKWHFADADVSIVFDFLVDGNFVVPTSATFNVRGDDYASLDSGVATLVAGATSFTLAVSAANNGIGADTFQFRYLEVVFIFENNTYTVTYAYGLTPWLPVWVTADNVRARLGLSADELPNADVNLFGAHVELVKELGDAYTTTVGVEEAFNRVLMLKTAIISAKGIMLKARMLDIANDFTARRFNLQVDFSALQAGLQADLADAIAALTGVPTATPTTMVLSAPVDPVTNA